MYRLRRRRHLTKAATADWACLLAATLGFVLALSTALNIATGDQARSIAAARAFAQAVSAPDAPRP